MHTNVSLFLMLAGGAFCGCLSAASWNYPKTEARPVTETLHGVAVTDPYRWLEDQNSPETRRWIAEQKAFADPVFAGLAARPRLLERLSELMKVDTLGAPIYAGGRYFYTRRRADQNQPMLCFREGLKGAEQVLLDPNSMSAGQSASIELYDITQDGKRVIYGLRNGGEDETDVRVFSVDDRRDLADRMPKGRYGISSLPDGSAFYYSKFFPGVGWRIYRHSLGAAAGDPEVFAEGLAPEKFSQPAVSHDGHYLVVLVATGSTGERAEVYVQDLKAGGGFRAIVKGIDARFDAVIHGDLMFLRTNWKAPKNRVMLVDLRRPEQANWREIIPEGRGSIEQFDIAGGKLLVRTLEDVHDRLQLFSAAPASAGKLERELALPGIGTVAQLSSDPGQEDVFVSFTSFTTPTEILRVSTRTDSREVWARLEVPVNTSDFATEQVWYASKDGTRIPMFLVHRKDLKKTGALPTVLYGYGGFNISMTPAFSPQAAAWVESGGVYAVANLRGGGEFGEKWHRAGMLENKQNVFDDFIGAAEWLIANQYTNPSKLAISGSSNGGLLVGAALTQRPDLFQAVVCAVPLLDMLRFHRFLVAKWWVSEYGSADDPKQFQYLLKYSPYQHVEKGVKYPAVMFVTGDSDTRVAPLHARKMTALLEASTASDLPILLHYDTQAGHSQGQPLQKRIEDLADQFAFLFWQLGMTPQRAPARVTSGVATAPDGVPIAYDVRGQGATTLLFVHCFACDRSFWREQADVFADRYQVVTLDLGGHGQSGKNRKPWTILGLAGDVKAVADQLGLRRVILVGHSMGGPVSLEAAHLLRGRVIGVVAADALHDAGQRLTAQMLDPIVARFQADFAGTMRAMVASQFPDTRNPQARDWVAEKAAAADPAVMLELLRDFVNVDFARLFANAGVPIRAIQSKPPVSPPTALEVNRKYADFDAVFMEGVGHFVELERPAEFNDKLRAWVEALDK